MDRALQFDHYFMTSVLLSSHTRQESRGRSDCDHTWKKMTNELCLVVCAYLWVRYNETGMWDEC